jgi:uncharacterized protein YybS (DUF2232 family)
LNNSTNLRRMIETALLSAIAIVIILLSSVPFLAFFFVVAAVPITVLTARQGLYAGITGSIVTGILLLMMFDPITAFSNVVMFGFSGVAAGFMFRKKWNASRTILASALFFSLGLSIILFGYTYLGGVDVFDSISKSLDQASTMIKERSIDMKLPQEDIKIQMDMVKVINDTIAKTKPAIVISYGFLIATLTFFISRPILKRSGTEVSDMVKFKDFKLPSSILPGILLMVGLTFLTDYIGYIDKDIIFINFVVLFNYIFAFQGASTLAFLTVERGGNVEKRSVLVIFATILCVLFFGLQVLSILGLMDATIDIRKLYKNRKV